MKIATTLWTRNRNTLSVDRGPLTYSLRIGERWEKKGDTEEWPGFEVYPTTPWNYGLLVDTSDPARSFEVVRKPGPLAAQPFALEAGANGMVGEVEPGAFGRAGGRDHADSDGFGAPAHLGVPANWRRRRRARVGEGGFSGRSWRGCEDKPGRG
jgi:hypothetical protein